MSVAASASESSLVEPDLDELRDSIDPARGGGMRLYLLTTPEGNRNRILGLAINEAGFECPRVKAAGTVGEPGNSWRAHCGDSLIYWVAVNEFSEFSVAPMPYGDVGTPRDAVPRRSGPVPTQPERLFVPVIPEPEQ